MTPPHSPSFTDTSNTTSVPAPPSPLARPCPSLPSPACPTMACITQMPSSAHPIEKTTPPPCRAMATSVIRHTADSSLYQNIPQAVHPQKAEKVPSSRQPETETPTGGTCQNSSRLPYKFDKPSITPSPQSPPPTSSPPIICQMFPVAQPGVISATFIQKPALGWSLSYHSRSWWALQCLRGRWCLWCRSHRCLQLHSANRLLWP